MKPIDAYNILQIYLISENGNIKNSKTNRFLHPVIDHNGYLQIKLYDKDSKRKSYLIHRLVAMTFLKNENSSILTVDHIDGNKLNNNVDNLRWVTMLDNINLSKKSLYKHSTKSTTLDLVNSVIKELENGTSIKEICIKYECSKSFVCRIKQKKRWKNLTNTRHFIKSSLTTYTPTQIKDICYYIINGKRNNEISKIIFGEISKTYCNTISNIRCGKSHNDFMKFVINNNYKPSTTISQESTQ